MTEATDGNSLPASMFELLLDFAGRVDDGTLAEVRALLATAEADRGMALLAGSLAAGRIPVSEPERARLQRMATGLLLDGSLVDELVVNPELRPPRHRFTSAAAPEDGVAEALRRTLRVVPGVKSLHCTWRTTPAGALAGPVPRLVVLAAVAMTAFPAGIGYRMKAALHRAGIRAGVEVMPEGLPVREYHRQALAAAVPVALPGEAHGQHGAPPPPTLPADQVPAAAAEPEPNRAPTSGQHSAPTPDKGASSVFFPDEAGEEVAEAAATTDTLNDRERDLLRQLHEELGKREDEQQQRSSAHDRDTDDRDTDDRDTDDMEDTSVITDAPTAVRPAPGTPGASSVNGWPADHRD